jgi:hypothetical protein
MQPSAASQIEGPVPRGPIRPGQDVIGIPEPVRDFECRQHHLLENVVGRVNVSNHGGRQSSHPEPFTK